MDLPNVGVVSSHSAVLHPRGRGPNSPVAKRARDEDRRGSPRGFVLFPRAEAVLLRCPQTLSVQRLLPLHWVVLHVAEMPRTDCLCARLASTGVVAVAASRAVPPLLVHRRFIRRTFAIPSRWMPTRTRMTPRLKATSPPIANARVKTAPRLGRRQVPRQVVLAVLGPAGGCQRHRTARLVQSHQR